MRFLIDALLPPLPCQLLETLALAWPGIESALERGERIVELRAL